MYESFIKKHITFIVKEHQIKYDVLKAKLHKSAHKRTKHTFIIVLGNDDHSEKETIEAFKRRLDDVISRKIREKKCNETNQTTLDVKDTCKNIKKEHIMMNGNRRFIKLSKYFKCPVNMNDLHVNLFLLNFNPKEETAPCKYSKHGSFYVGVGEIQNETRSDIQNGWFLVNHLEKSILNGVKKNCSKK